MAQWTQVALVTIKEPYALETAILLSVVKVVTTMLSKGYTLGKDTLSKAKELDEKYQVMDTAAAKVANFGKFFEEISKAALITTGHVACNAGIAAVNNSDFATGALMVAGVLDRLGILTGQPKLLLILVIGIMQQRSILEVLWHYQVSTVM